MSDIVQRIAVIAERYHRENAGSFHPGDLAELLVAELGLHEDQYRSAFAPDDCDYDKVRYSTPWLDRT